MIPCTLIESKWFFFGSFVGCCGWIVSFFRAGRQSLGQLLFQNLCLMRDNRRHRLVPRRRDIPLPARNASQSNRRRGKRDPEQPLVIPRCSRRFLRLERPPHRTRRLLALLLDDRFVSRLNSPRPPAISATFTRFGRQIEHQQVIDIQLRYAGRSRPEPLLLLERARRPHEIPPPSPKTRARGQRRRRVARHAWSTS